MKKHVKIITSLLIVVLSVILIASLTACGTPDNNKEETLIVGSTMKVDLLDRRQVNGGEPGYNFDILSASLSQLTPVLQMDGNYQPMLCDYKVSEDEKVWSFKVKDGFTWHDGNPVNNQDLMFTMSDMNDKYIKYANIEEKDGWVVVTLATPNPKLLDQVTMMRMYPKHIFGREDIATLKDEETIVGCGPFKFESRDKNKDIIVFSKYDKYPYASSVAFDKVIVKFYDENAVMNLALKNGEIDMIYGYQKMLTSSEIKDFSKDSNITIQSYDTNSMTKILFMNVEKTTAKERKAVQKAIDYEELRRVFTSGEAMLPTEGFIPKKAFGAIETSVLTRDLEGSRTLLREEGYTENNKFDFEILAMGNTDDSQYASRLKTQLEETGLINVIVIEKAKNDWQNTVHNGNHMAIFRKITEHGFSMQAGYATKYMLPRNSSALNNNPVCCANIKLEEGETRTRFGNIYYALQNAGTNAELQAAVKSYQEYMVEETPAIALILDKASQAYRSSLTGFKVVTGFDIFNVKSFETLKRI